MFHQVFEDDLGAKRIDVQNIGADTIVVWIGLGNSLQSQCDGTEGEEYSFHGFDINRVDDFFWFKYPMFFYSYMQT